MDFFELNISVYAFGQGTDEGFGNDCLHKRELQCDECRCDYDGDSDYNPPKYFQCLFDSKYFILSPTCKNNKNYPIKTVLLQTAIVIPSFARTVAIPSEVEESI